MLKERCELTLIQRRVLAFVRRHGPVTKARVVREVCQWDSGTHYWCAMRDMVRLGVLRQVRPNRKGKTNGGGVVEAAAPAPKGW